VTIIFALYTCNLSSACNSSFAVAGTFLHPRENTTPSINGTCTVSDSFFNPVTYHGSWAALCICSITGLTYVKIAGLLSCARIVLFSKAARLLRICDRLVAAGASNCRSSMKLPAPLFEGVLGM